MTTAIVSVEYLQRRLQWEAISLERAQNQWGGYAVLRVHPTSPDLSAINLNFDYGIETIDSVEYFSSKAHAHFERWGCEHRNVVEAVRSVDRLVKRTECLVEYLDSKGDYLGSAIVQPREVPETLSKSTKQLRRTFFDRAPQLEPVPWRLYLERDHLYISKTLQAELDRIRRKLVEQEDGVG